MVSDSLTDRRYGLAVTLRPFEMLIVCPTCATSYDIPLATLGEGRTVRCASCKNAWFATAERELETAVAAPVATVSLAKEAPPAAELPSEFEFDSPALQDSGPVQEILPPVGSANMLTVTNAPSLVPFDPPPADAEPDVAKFEPGIPDVPETPAVRPARNPPAPRKARRSALRQLFSLPMLIIVMLGIVLGALNWRAKVVRHFPQTASLYAAIGLPVNLRGLYFQDVKSKSETLDGVSVLVIEGTIVNLTTHTLNVPRLRFALRSASGQEVYAWTAQPPQPKLGSGHGLQFRGRLASPPPDGNDVIVRFLNRRDLGASAQ
jgi:predicted Zn finger-like uncharacterized protein